MAGILRRLKPDQKARIIRPANWRGMAPDVDPQNLAEDQPFLAINTRLEGGQHVIRSGQSQVCNVGGQVTAVTTHQLGAGGPGTRGLLLARGGWNYIVSSTISHNGFNLWDSENTALPMTSRFSNPGSQLKSAVCKFGDDVLIGQLETVTEGTAVYFAPVIRKLQNGVFVHYLTLPRQSGLAADWANVTALAEHNGTLLIGIGATTNSAGNAAIVSYDGSQVKVEVTGIRWVQNFVQWRDQMIAVIALNTATIQGGSYKVRAANGTWGALLTAPVVYARNGGAAGSGAASYLDKLYIPADGDSQIPPTVYSSAGMTTLDTTAIGFPAAGFWGISAFTVFNGYLYFLWWYTNSPTFEINVGRYDGTTWTIRHKNLWLQLQSQPQKQPPFVATTALPVPVGYGAAGASMIVQQGSLVVFLPASWNGTNSFEPMLFSPGIDTAGTWKAAWALGTINISPSGGYPMVTYAIVEA